MFTLQNTCYEVILTPYYTLLRNDSVSAHPLRYSPSVQGDNEGVHIPLTTCCVPLNTRISGDFPGIHGIYLVTEGAHEL